MTDMEKKVVVRRCTKIVTETDPYETDKEVQNLIDLGMFIGANKRKQ